METGKSPMGASDDTGIRFGRGGPQEAHPESHVTTHAPDTTTKGIGAMGVEPGHRVGSGRTGTRGQGWTEDIRSGRMDNM